MRAAAITGIFFRAARQIYTIIMFNF